MRGYALEWFFGSFVKMFGGPKLATTTFGLLRQKKFVIASPTFLGAVAVKTKNGASGKSDPSWYSFAKSLQYSTPHSSTRSPSLLCYI